MRTAVISDLHLGAASRADLLQRRSMREKLMPALAGADRIILLGDTLEMRDRPLADVLQAARPFFEELRENAPDAELVIVPGNHDYQLLEPWLQKRRVQSKPAPIGVEERISPTGDAVAEIAGWAGRSRTVIAYPGLYLRDDVYATHGHYLDSHLTTPTFERLGIGALRRFTRGSGDAPSSPEHYERVHAPLYALLFALAQGPRAAAAAPKSRTPSMRVWQALGGASGTARGVRGRVLGSAVLPGAVKLASRAGLGKLSADLSLAEIGRAGARAMADVVAELDLKADHVIFGHTHRRGPMTREPDPQVDWRAGDARLYNSGSWVYSPALIGADASASAYWPGTLLEVADTGEPSARELLSDMTKSEIREALSVQG